MMPNRIIKVAFFIIMVVVLGSCCQYTVVSAVKDSELVSGDGQSESGWTKRNCNIAYRIQNVKQCSFETSKEGANGDNSPDHDTGGASWHIFSINNLPVTWKHYKKDVENGDAENPYQNPVYNKIGNNTGFEIDEIKNECEDFDYYVAYVYDGWDRERAGNIDGIKGRKYSVYFGPIGWGTFEAVADEPGEEGSHFPVYHYLNGNKTGGAHSANDVLNSYGIKNMHGWRLDGGLKDGKADGLTAEYVSEEADLLWARLSGKKNDTVPLDGKGWFCLKPVYDELTIEPYFIDDDGTVISMANTPGFGIQKKKVKRGHDYSYSRNKFSAGTDYSFKGWVDDKGDSRCNGMMDKCTVNVVGDRTVRIYFGPYEVQSSINMTVNGVDNYYARPDAVLNFHTEYGSDAQVGYSKIVEVVRAKCTGSSDYQRSPSQTGVFNKDQIVGNLYSAVCGTWNNDLHTRVNSSEFTHPHPNGLVGVFNYDWPWPIQLDQNNTGGVYSGTAWITAQNPRYIKTGVSSGGYHTKINVIGYLDDFATAYVPYNFNNRAVINNDGSEIAYAGEKISLNADYIIGTKPNNVTSPGQPYATTVRNRKWKLQLCIKNTTTCYSSEEQSMNDAIPANMFSNDNKESIITQMNIPDIAAGNEVCAVISIYPYTSGDDRNTSVDANGYGDWANSNQVCFKIGKRPSIQVWGGNIYSRGNIKTSASKKNNLHGYDSFQYVVVGSGSRTRSFGSWGENGVISNGTITSFGSGASLGYSGRDDNNMIWPRFTYKDSSGSTRDYIGSGNTSGGGEPGGSSKSFCNRIPLTIPNAQCANEKTSIGLSSAIGMTQANTEKKVILDVLGLNNENAEVVEEVNSDLIDSINNSEMKAYGNKGGDIRITSDLIYLDKSYVTYEDIPKLVIYAKNIKISCNVERIDALLIADEEVDTCMESTNNVSEGIRSRQLFINGAVIADKLIAKRTYGAASGANSVIPAEIINFDPTLYDFGNSSKTDDDVAGRLDVTYMRELSPRL